ncbi:MAG TPA: hypothetical protein VFS94_02720 [Gemmatimonadales bacterium]|nr:hypothetical protein [Gemmatimonadales bacterium]
MVSLVALWLPILLSAVLIFVVSAIVHTVMPWHHSDFKAVPNQDGVMAALRPFAIPPGDYLMPKPANAGEMKSPEYLEKHRQGPVAVMTVLPGGNFSMTGSLIQWFFYCIVVSLFAAYVAGRALGPGAEYLRVFQLAGATAFAGYSLALVQQSIWFKKQWTTTLKSMTDGLLYALLTAGVLGWMWP